MNILCLTPWFPAHDEEKEGNFVRDSVDSLRALGHHVEVLVTRAWRPGGLRGGEGQQAEQARPCVHQLKYLSIPRNHLRGLSNHLYHWGVASELEAMARRTRADVIHVHTELPAITAVRVARKMGIPCIVTLHGINPAPRLNTRSQHAVLRRTLGGASRIVLVGEPLRPFFAPIVQRTDHFRVVPNGFRPPAGELRRQGTDWNDPLQFISVSNLHEGKGIELNLQALARLREQGLDRWHYRIVGGGTLRAELERLAAELGLAAQVTFVGPVGHQEVYRHLRTADVFILPSYREAFGIAYLEAMACGLLTLGVRDQGPATFITHGETGLLTAPRDVADLAAQLASVLRHPQQMHDIARRGQEHVCREFTWERHAQKLASIFTEAVEEQQCHRAGH